VHRTSQRTVKDESGQVLVLLAALLVVLIAFAGFAIDVGHAYLVQRQLQAATDAAALAGAQELPDVATAQATAIQYGPTPGPNHPNGVTSVDNAITDPPVVKCVVAVGCTSRRGRKNAIQVTTSSVVPTIFARVVGRNSFTVHARATACSPCTAKKFDVMIVLDRTGSMQGADLANAKDGVRQFLLAMDPTADAVGLAVLPPALSTSSVCTAPSNGAQRYGYNAWWPGWVAGGGPPTSVYAVAPPTQDFLVESPANSGKWVLNNASSLVQQLACIQAGGTTSYANAIAEAKHALKIERSQPGRSDAQDVIVFFTDGAANTMPAHGNLPATDGLSALNLELFGTDPPNGHPLKPCGAGVAAANWAKAQDATVVYTIGYDVQGSNGGNCGEAGYTAESALRAMATDPINTFYMPRAGDDLGLLFDRIAQDILKSKGQLIDDGLK
jgi:Flp pilus assembly protein TadG